MANSADLDQWLQKPTDLDLHCLQKQVFPGSAGQGLTTLWVNSAYDQLNTNKKRALTTWRK